MKITEKGQRFIELMLVVIFLMILVLAIAEYGTLLNRYLNLLDASSEAARLASDLDPSYCLNWDCNVWFEITIATAAVPAGGFGYPTLSSIHASPAKTSSSTLEVRPGADPSLPPYFDN